MKCADVAMYHSKEAGRNQTKFYLKSLHKRMENRFEIERELYRAVEQGQFELYYQPQIRTENLTIAGVEALIRWNHPQKGVIPPMIFIPVAEELGLIHKIGNWVIETAMHQMQDWRRRFAIERDHFFISINVSPIQLSNDELKDFLEQSLRKFEVNAKHFEIEITENAIIDQPSAGQLLQDLSALGFCLALDDFGSGFSSICQLINHPFQVIKADKSFFQSHMKKNNGPKIMKAINAFATILGMKVVAEGVETLAHQKCCQSLKLDRMQGFFFSKPVPAIEIEELWLVPKTANFFCEVS
jgi:EAL domain-containing protein (putative c-di-GMP-specific phosphodiesterase class I)